MNEAEFFLWMTGVSLCMIQTKLNSIVLKTNPTHPSFSRKVGDQTKDEYNISLGGNHFVFVFFFLES